MIVLMIGNARIQKEIDEIKTTLRADFAQMTEELCDVVDLIGPQVAFWKEKFQDIVNSKSHDEAIKLAGQALRGEGNPFS